MELKLKFNEDAGNYDQWRPTYVPELFHEVIRHSGLNENKRALEIGIGTGQATLPLLNTGCITTAVEIGENLAEYSRQKFAGYTNLEVINTDFESWQCDNDTFDLIYSATAFHWIPEEIGYPKVYDLLKHGGTLALFWNHAYVNRADDILHREIRKIYNKYRPTDHKNPAEFSKEDCNQKIEIIQHYGFSDVYSKLFYQTRCFTPEGYIALLNTYSDHRALPEDVKNGLENEITHAIMNHGGKLNVYDTIDLYLASKR